MERELNGLTQSELDIEIVNAGVSGYNFERVLKRIDEFLAVDPDLVTIYLGWNRTINRADPRKNQFLYRKLSLYRIYYHLVQNRKDSGLQENFQIKNYFDPNDPALGEYRAHSFEFDMHDLNTLIDAIKKKNEAIKIVIITLAGIFDYRVSPDSRALEVAFPTSSTNNLYAWPLLTSLYNNRLRQLVNEDDRVQLIDFEAYALDHFVPRHAYFVDSVHLTNEGYRQMGVYFAGELLKFIPALTNSAITQQ
jgi:lysophospholipase L1-like esterase